MKRIMLGAEDVRALLTTSVTTVGRVRIEISQGGVNEAVRILEDTINQGLSEGLSDSE